jgi:hypothetical protein
MNLSNLLESTFTVLKAENEPWLGDVFVSPPAFDRLMENRPTILYGESGSGKSALRLEMKRRLNNQTLSVLWMPEPLPESLVSGTPLANQAMRQALRSCVETIILEGKLHQRLAGSPEWVAAALQWFLRTYLPFEPVFFLQSQGDRLAKEEVQWYLELLDKSAPTLVNENASINDQMRLLLMVLHQANYDQLWLTVDGLERWSRHTEEQIGALLDAVLSTLVIFDVPGIIFKFFAPLSLKQLLHTTSGVERHRAEEIQLDWSETELQSILNKRLALAFGSPKFSLNMLSEGQEFMSWLKDFGGGSPRDWLKLARPLVTEYKRQGKRLTSIQWHETARQYPPPLWLDTHRREAWIGKKCIRMGSSHEFRLLEYLYARPGKISSLEELYYYAQAELDAIPDKGSEKWVHKDIWRPAMDTMIWRLRQKIEQNPKEPIYLITHHGKGLELFHVNM